MLRIPVLASLLLLVALAGCAGADDPAPSAASAEVAIHGFAFDPATLRVSVGTVVEFTNHDSAAHTATADGGAFDTGTLGKDQSDEVRFDRTGTFAYHCTIHPSMKGSVVVS